MMKNWIHSDTSNNNLILFGKVSLYRNLDGMLFTDKLKLEEAKNNVDILSKVIFNKLDNEELKLIKLWDSESDYIKSFKSRFLITNDLFKRKDRAGLIVNKEETISIMINELDHLNIQCITDGMNLKEAYETVNNIDDLIEEDISYSFHDEFGYLTATTSNVGTGMKVTVALHLPALAMSEEITNISKNLIQLGIVINPVYVDNNKPYGNIYEVSNRISLGVTEEEIINNIEGVVNKIIKEELKFRETLLNKYKDELEDKILRAEGILKSAKLISFKELVELLSYVRLGVETSLLDLNKDVLNKLLVYTDDNCIKNRLGKSLSVKDRNMERAIVVKALFG